MHSALAAASSSLLLVCFVAATLASAEDAACSASGGEEGSCRTTRRVAIVTGGNRGIGFDVVSGLLSRLPSDFVVLLTGRREDAVSAAVRCLRERHYSEGSGNTCCEGIAASEQPCHHGSWFYKEHGAGPDLDNAVQKRLQSFLLDLSDSASISTFVKHVRDAYGRVDILVNNGAAPSRAGPEQHVTIDHFGHLTMYNELLPVLQPGARIVHVGSEMGNLRSFSPVLREKLLDPNLPQETLDAMLREYLELAKHGRHQEAGWPGGSGYSVAKMANAATARIQARDLKLQRPELGDDILVNACCPGPANAPHTQQGAHVITYLAMLPPGDGRTGRWFVDRGWTGTPWEVPP